jgi:hypothetical protein
MLVFVRGCGADGVEIVHCDTSNAVVRVSVSYACSMSKVRKQCVNMAIATRRIVPDDDLARLATNIAKVMPLWLFSPTCSLLSIYGLLMYISGSLAGAVKMNRLRQYLLCQPALSFQPFASSDPTRS